MRLHQTLKHLLSKGNINRVKSNLRNGKKTFITHASDKELIYRIYKELLQHNKNKINK